MAAAPISPNRHSSHLRDLPIATLLNRSHSSSKSSTGFDDPRASTTTLHPAIHVPFPRQTSAEFFRHSPSATPSPSSAPPSPFGDMLASPPTWPNPASYSFSKPVPPNETRDARRVGAVGANLICFELALGDRLAARLNGETATLRSIKEASGVISAELTDDEGPKKLVSTGSASAVQKARQLLDAKLSQTPIRSVVGIKLAETNPSLTLIPSTGLHVSRFQPLSTCTYRLVTTVLPPTSLDPLARPRLGSFPSTTSIVSELSLPPSQSQSESTTPIVLTPASSGNPSFFANAESTSPAKLSSALLRKQIALQGDKLPQIGNLDRYREPFVKNMVDELEFSVKRRSLVRVKLDIGSQEWRREGRAEAATGRERWSIEEIETWRTDGVDGQSPSPVSPTFSTSLSAATARKYLSTLGATFEKKSEISQVHILHLDKSRASFGCAIAECRGQELRDLPQGSTASGTLVLKKCSTLPSKPFALSIVTPTLASNRQEDGTDLRLKILADKAATSPSLDLSAAMQSATWEVDDLGDFRVKIDLKEERFGKGETEIRWNSRERWENQDGTLRFTIAENRYSDSSRHDYSIELCSPTLNQLLANYALDQAQGKKAKWEREKVRAWTDKLIAFGETFVNHA